MEARASITAAIVATFRSFGELLPPDTQIARDPWGARFAGPWAERALELGKRIPLATKPIERFVLYMQVRTRAIDDVLLDFVRSGGRQVVLLGAGFDARALRFADELRETTSFEIDHPATQEKKKSAAPPNERIKYLSFDFEAQPVSLLPEALDRVGHVRTSRTLTIWEGVTMYLTEGTIDATLSAVHAYSAPGSLLAFTYFEKRRMLERPGWRQRIVRRFVASVGEPFRFGWDEGQIGPWLAPRGFELVSDQTDTELAHLLLPASVADRVEASGRHVAVASVTGDV